MTRGDDLTEHLFHTWASCNDFSTKSCREIISRKISDWSALINDIKISNLVPIPSVQFITSYDNTASVGIMFVDELYNFDVVKCGKSYRRHRAVRSRRIKG